MDIKLLDYIKELSLNDKKSLSQKALKTSEECGELAKVVLPFESAPGTIHRFVDKGRILNECADVILTVMSIAYDLGYSHEDIEDMMRTKAEYWQSLQMGEDEVDGKIPYEIHVTISINSNEITVDNFKTHCELIGVKPIVLDLENSGEVVMKDVMTSSHHYGNNTSVYEECERIALELNKGGFNVVRQKIETVPWHPMAPKSTNTIPMPPNCYFEAHIGCVITPSEKDILQEIARNNFGHLSRNFFKKLDNGKFVNMLTMRWYSGTYEDIIVNLKDTKDDLLKHGIDFEKVITEFCLYDTKVSHDYIWLNK